MMVVLIGVGMGVVLRGWGYLRCTRCMEVMYYSTQQHKPHACQSLVRPECCATGEAIVSMMIIGFVTLIKLAGTDWLVRASGAFFVLSIVPTMIYMLYGAKKLKWDNLTVMDEGEQGLDISLLISWVLWLYAGFLRCVSSLIGVILHQ